MWHLGTVLANLESRRGVADVALKLLPRWLQDFTVQQMTTPSCRATIGPHMRKESGPWSLGGETADAD